VADRTRYLLAYDIRDQRRLRRVHRVATDFGEPLQYSLFVCDLTQVELSRFKSALLDEMKTTEDSVSIFDLGAPGRSWSESSSSAAGASCRPMSLRSGDARGQVASRSPGSARTSKMPAKRPDRD
jgi:CRISPR-associated protein Cas2